MKIRTPKAVPAATALLERYAALEGELAGIEERRARVLARANAAADTKAGPLVGELEAIEKALEPWWTADGKSILPKGRKSMELGGCKIGSRSSKAKLVHSFDDDDAAIEALKAEKLVAKTTRTKLSLDRRAISTLIEANGRLALRLKALGFSLEPGEDTFFIERVAQAGTLGS